MVRKAMVINDSRIALARVIPNKKASPSRYKIRVYPPQKIAVTNVTVPLNSKETKGCDMKLSVREAQILELLCHGFTNKTIAQQLDISPHTVRGHISTMSNRFHVKGRAALVTVYLHRTAAHAIRPHIGVSPQ
jgi:DNA-binding NarL/FixJ family response regulator